METLCPEPSAYSRVHMEAKGPHEFQQGLAHGHSHLKTSRNMGTLFSLPLP